MADAQSANSTQRPGNSEPRVHRRKFILCFDGTGNKFAGTDADSNILKIYRMLDRSDSNQFHYYQPGIGTYVNTTSLTHTSVLRRLKSAYVKSKDAAIGTSFDYHVMGGYKFLMRYYVTGDDIYLFGFSRGAYTARFLAEMLDHVGLLSAGNEEMCRFAWKTFQKWQTRQERTDEEREQKKQILDFMCAFRETFSRPVRPIRFIGLFDTVNSVPMFENAWMQRSKFPYTARTTARVIRHAVALDERRAKFRQDLVSETKADDRHRHQGYLRSHRRARQQHQQQQRQPAADATKHGHDAESGACDVSARLNPSNPVRRRRSQTAFRDQSETSGIETRSPNIAARRRSEDDGASVVSSTVARDGGRAAASGAPPSILSHDGSAAAAGDESDDEADQDIKEVWFAGCHADIGGGWPLDAGHDSALSHVPLVWMVREAQRAGLNFDDHKLYALNYATPAATTVPRPRGRRRPAATTTSASATPVPEFALTVSSPADDARDTVGTEGLADGARDNDDSDADTDADADADTDDDVRSRARDPDTSDEAGDTPFQQLLHFAATKGRIHDVLQFRNGAGSVGVLAWNVMEYLPFRRMDLQADGSWRTIRWPLPMGETRDVPDNVVVHHSVLRRMRSDPEYRPGNLICGGGGRGVRRAPEEMGMGRWKVVMEEDDIVSECYVREAPPSRTDSEKKSSRQSDHLGI